MSHLFHLHQNCLFIGVSLLVLFMLGNDFLCHMRRDIFIVGKFHFEIAAAAGHGTKGGGVACLLLMAVHGFSLLCDGFLIRNTRNFRQQVDLELGFSAADGNINVLIAHTLQNGLVGVHVIVPGQGHVFFAEAGQSRADLGGVGLGLREDGNAVEGTRQGYLRA